MKNCNTLIKHGLLVFTVLLVFAIGATLGVYYGIIKPQLAAHESKDKQVDGTYLETAQDIPTFSLMDNHGNTFTRDNLKGHWTMMFFGFTSCGMICPTTMAALNSTYKSLQKELPNNQLPQVVFISVDPDRDTVKKINDYVLSFNSNFVGARTDIKRIAELEKNLHIVVTKIEVDNKGNNHYTIHHSAEILVINPQGKLQATLSYPHEPRQMVKDYKLILSTTQQ